MKWDEEIKVQYTKGIKTNPKCQPIFEYIGGKIPRPPAQVIDELTKLTVIEKGLLVKMFVQLLKQREWIDYFDHEGSEYESYDDLFQRSVDQAKFIEVVFQSDERVI